MSDLALVKDLVRAVPDLASAYDEHEKDYDEVLTHVLMADFARAVMSWAEQALRGDEHSARLIDAFLEVIERALAEGGADQVDVIMGSFLENIDEDTAEAELLAQRFDRHTAAAYRRVQGTE